jgi:hypothetical protein
VDVSAVRHMTGTWLLIVLVLLLIIMMMCTLPAVTFVEDLAVRLAFILLRVAVDMFQGMNKRNAEGTCCVQTSGRKIRMLPKRP